MTLLSDNPYERTPPEAHTQHRAAHLQRLRTLVASMPASRLPALGAEIAQGGKLRRNAYVGSGHETLPWQDQLIVMAWAVHDAAHHDPIFSHVTAAVVWGLPMIGARSRLVEHVLPPDARGRSANVRRRRTELSTPYVDLGGLRVTPYERTVVDHARHASLESAVSVCDDGLHRSLTTRDALLAEWERVPKGHRGRSMAQLAIHLADERAESPLESLSRVRMFQTGLPMPELQWRCYDGDGFVGRTDFYWEHLGLVGECDGKLKYAVPEGDSPRDAVDALLQEKQRGLRLRRHAEVDDLARWNWDEALPFGSLHRILVAHGLRSVADGGGWPVPHGPLPRRAFVG